MAAIVSARGAATLAAALLCFFCLVLLSLQGAETFQKDNNSITTQHFTLDRRKREESPIINHLQELSNELRPKKRKGRRRKKFQNETVNIKKRRKERRKWNQTSPGLLMPLPSPGIIGNTIIRTSENDGPQHRMLIQTFQNTNSSAVRYFANFPQNWRESRQKGRHHHRDRTTPPRYGDTSLNWRGLRFGCACHPAGSESTSCDIVSGQCPCRQNVTGRACDKCLINHWGLPSGNGCEPCECDSVGSAGKGCDSSTGQCVCLPGVGGIRCDTCQSSFYGFSEEGCKACDVCEDAGHVCDPGTGRCVCPLRTQGDKCQICSPNSWGHQPRTGCKTCHCDSGGSVRTQCDISTGLCDCRPGFAGKNCSECAEGHFGFPMCRPCLCHIAGSLNFNCNETGDCSCKQNVQGSKCDECRSGTFGLQKNNPNGCTACFCFGRSASCSQAGLSWSQIRSSRPRSVSIEYDPSPPFQNTLPIDTQEICYINLAVPGGGEVTLNGADRGLNVTNNLRTIPGDSEDVKIGVSFLFDTPVYWQLPEQFLGDKVLSYGGFLKFVVEADGGHTHLPPGVLSTYPLIQLQGNNKIILEYFPIIPSLSGRYDVRFHESLWYEKNPKKQASRESLMIALQHLQHILIRASDAVDFTRVILKEVSMDTAAVTTDLGVAIAGGVERCECPPQYNSTSCQNPSIGFFRWFNKTYSTATILINLVGEARPCECNNRSKICDVETGFCSGCSNNTGGPHCERCADGYYGDPAISPCKSCPCPSPDRNFATGCQTQAGRDPVCFCREGYTGKQCDRCGYGWYGYPEEPGGFCQPCDCHPFGSVSDECHEQTGQCNCRPGILGQDCTICPFGTVLTEKGCSTCQDGCTGILLQDLKAMSNELFLEAGKATDRNQVPWWRLQDFINDRVIPTEQSLANWQSSTRNGYHVLTDDASHKLKFHTKQINSQAQKLSNRSEDDINSVAGILNSQAHVMLDQLDEIRQDVENVLQTLDQYSAENRIVSDSAALMEAKRLLEKISSKYLVPRREQAERTLDLCTNLLLKTRFMEGNYPELQDVLQRLNIFREKINEFEALIQATLLESEKRTLQAGELKRKLRGVKEKLGKVNAGLNEVEKWQAESENILDEAEDAIMVADKHINNITNVKMSLKNSSLALERKEGILYGLNPLYRNKYVKSAQNHADALKRLAQDYQLLFNSSFGDASQAVEASKAYQEIVAIVENVREAAESATVSAEISRKEVFPTSNDDSVIEKAVNSKAVSSRLLSRAKAQTGGQELRSSLEQEKLRVLKLQDTVRETAIQDNAISSDLQKLDNLKVGDTVKSAIDKVTTLENKLDEAKVTTKNLVEKVEANLRPQLTALTAEAKYLNLTKARSDIEESLKTNQRSIELLQQLTSELDLRKQRQSFRLANESLSSVLINLRNKITEARHAAHGVRLSLSSNTTQGCVRSYKIPGLEPTIANRIVLTLSLNPNERNGLLLYLPSSTTSDFLAVELVNGKLRFVWDLGGGPGNVSKSLDTSSRKREVQSKWYKIVIERTSYTARLWINPDDKSLPASNSSSSDYGWLDLSTSDRLWIGGLPAGQEPPQGILSTHTGLIGCLHSVTLDDMHVGLWNFFLDHTDGCSACVKGFEETVDESAYRFNGEGYSVLQHASKSTHNKYQFSVALRFRTYDDNAVLFLALSPHKDRYISILLRDGHVVFQISYSGDSQLEMSSTRRYNDGNWTSLEASRSFDRRRGIEKGLLKVGDEAKEAAPPIPPLQTQIPELFSADYLVGGVPQGYNFGQLHLRLPKSFLGCMSDLFIDKDLYNPLRGRSNGVSPSCAHQIIKVAGFHGEGYLRMEASHLKKKSSFSLVLRTLQADAIVLLAKDKKTNKIEEEKDEESNMIEVESQTESNQNSHKDSYYSVALVDGRVEVRLEAGRGAITLVSQALVNDGRFHAIAVTKTGRKVELRVDDELQAASTLPEGAIIVRADDLYIGGVPKGIEASLYVSDTTPFTGTIKDILFDYTLQNLENHIGFFGVELGRLGPEREGLALVPSLVRTSTPHPGCRRSRKYVVDPGAVKFGDSPHSNVQLNLRRRNIFVKNFTIEMDFRTFRPDGLLFLVPSTHKGMPNFKHFLLGSLRNGQANIIFKGKKKLDLISPAKVNDGSWHHLILTREDRKLSLAVDSSESATIKLPKKMNAGNVFYIGGLPEKVDSLPNILVKLPRFQGCVRTFRLNNQTEDLIGEKAQHQNVGQCFPQIEKGSYFSGDAYIIHNKSFLIEDLFKLELDFRTSEQSGILLSISHPLGYPAFALEFAAGKVLLSGDTGDRRIFKLSYEFPSPFAICDNKWHHIAVSYVAEEVEMKVDDDVKRLPLIRNDYFMKEYLDVPMYIGGLPDHVPGSKPLLESRDNFKGCMRNVMIAGERKDWTEMHMHNVYVGSCPAVTQL